MAGQKQEMYFQPETPPVTPLYDADDTTMICVRQEIELKTFERTPRKPSNPQRTPVHEDKEGSAMICFKFIESKEDEKTPELNITSVFPVSMPMRSRAKRRLWGGDSEPLTYINLDIKQKRSQPELSMAKATTKCTPYLSQSDKSDYEDESKDIHITHKSYCNSVRTVHQRTERNEYHLMGGETKQYSQKSSRSAGSKSKVCASCSTRKTPLWRDSDDGTPYCNACGIRFKKYRVRCSVCLYIPRKDEKTNNCCYLCGAQLVRYRFNGNNGY